MFNPRLLPVMLLALILAVSAGCSSSEPDPESQDIALNDSNLQITPKAAGQGGSNAAAGGSNMANAGGNTANNGGALSSRNPNEYNALGEPYAYGGSLYGVTTPVAQADWTREEIKVASFVRSGNVYFHFDSSALTASAKEVLKQKAMRLRAFPQLQVVVAGHSDERGSDDYNLDLGNKRAQSVYHYLVSQGVHPSQLKTTSFGKMYPVAIGNNEGAWSQNRRVEFIIAKQF